MKTIAIAAILSMILMQQNSTGIVTVAQGSFSGVSEPTEAAVRNATDWQALWKSHAGAEVAAPIDFAREMVVAVFLGTRPTGGYSVEIVSTRREAGALIVEYAERGPAPGAIVTQALTSPFHIVKTQVADGQVRFRRIAPPPPVGR